MNVNAPCCFCCKENINDVLLQSTELVYESWLHACCAVHPTTAVHFHLIMCHSCFMQGLQRNFSGFWLELHKKLKINTREPQYWSDQSQSFFIDSFVLSFFYVILCFFLVAVHYIYIYIHFKTLYILYIIYIVTGHCWCPVPNLFLLNFECSRPNPLRVLGLYLLTI